MFEDPDLKGKTDRDPPLTRLLLYDAPTCCQTRSARHLFFSSAESDRGAAPGEARRADWPTTMARQLLQQHEQRMHVRMDVTMMALMR
jgi:hypothetical protein